MATTLKTGLLCVSVDSLDIRSLASDQAHRRTDAAQLLRQFALPSNWTIGDVQLLPWLPERAEVTARIPAEIRHRGELVRLLQQFQTGLAGRGTSLRTVAADPYQTKTHWDVLVRAGCLAARPRLSEPTRFTAPQAVRGGLWQLPIHCAFVGGAQKTIRAQFGICRRRLIEAANGRGIFHLIIDVENSRNSWREEHDALRSLFRAAAVQYRLGRLRFVTLGELPGLLAPRRRGTPLRSILRAA